jgi:hypothetical protein
VSEPRRRELARIRRSARAVELRLRIGRALAALPPALTAALAVSAGTLAVRKTLPSFLSEWRAREILAGAALAVVAGLVVALLRRLPPRAGTVALDRHHELHDRLSNALAFDALPAAERTALMEIAIDDACEHAPRLAPSKAAPLRLPRDLAAAALVGLGVAAIALFEVRVPRREAPVAKLLDPLSMSPDDIELFRDAARDLAQKEQSPDVKAAVDRFNQLIEDIAQKRLDRTEAFRRMEAIERELLKGAEADKKSLEDALDETGKELARSDLAKPIGDALQKKDLAQAQKELKDLASRLRDKKKVDKKELDRLREALRRAASRKKEALAALNEKRSELKEQLLKKKQAQDPDAGAQSPEEQRLLQKKERELERLDREAEERERAARQLDRLDRELSKAAEDLLRDLGLSAQDLEQAAEDINRLQDEQMSEKDKEELRQRLEELRELLRQQGQGGKQRMARLLKFGKRARGGQGQKGDKGEQGGQKGDQDGEEGEGQEGEEGQQPGGKGGQGEGQLVIGPGGKKILISKGGPGQGQGQGQGPSQPGDGQGQSAGQDEGGGHGDGIGSSHDPNLAGKRTDPKMGTADVQAQGLDTHAGPTNSEVILGAAERGFKGTGYKKVFTTYHTVAEQQMNKDTIPDGYRFYVHRYFQLIRPRE